MFGAEVHWLKQEWNGLERSGYRDPHGSNKEGKCDNQRRKWWSKFIVAVSVTVHAGILGPKWTVVAANSLMYRPSRYSWSHPARYYQWGMDPKVWTVGFPRNMLTLVSDERRSTFRYCTNQDGGGCFLVTVSYSSSTEKQNLNALTLNIWKNITATTNIKLIALIIVWKVKSMEVCHSIYKYIFLMI